MVSQDYYLETFGLTLGKTRFWLNYRRLSAHSAGGN